MFGPLQPAVAIASKSPIIKANPIRSIWSYFAAIVKVNDVDDMQRNIIMAKEIHEWS